MKRMPTPDYEGSHRWYNEHTAETLFEHYVGKNVTFFSWSATGMSMPCVLCGHVVKGPVALPCRSPTRNTMESSPLTALSAVAAGPSHSTIPPQPTRFRKPPFPATNRPQAAVGSTGRRDTDYGLVSIGRWLDGTDGPAGVDGRAEAGVVVAVAGR